MADDDPFEQGNYGGEDTPFDKSFNEEEESSYFQSIIEKEKVFDSNYIPPKLRHRAKELSQLGEYFSPLKNGENPKDLSIYGRTGTGKTAVIKYALNRLETKYQNSDTYLSYVNCKSNDTATRVFSKIARKICKKDLPPAGYGASTYFEELKAELERTGNVLITVLDEIDFLLDNEEELERVLYNLTNENDITTIMISNDATWKERIEDTRILSRMGARNMTFTAYTKDQLVDILEDRAAEGLRESTWNQEVLEYIAERASDEYGDARIGIKLLYESASEAEDLYSEEISTDDVDDALRNLEKSNIIDYVSTLPAQQKILTMALAEKYQNTPYITTSSLYNHYKELVEDSDRHRCVSKNMIYRYLKELQVYGIIDKKKGSNKGGGRGRKEMIIEPKFNPEELLEEIEKGNV